MLKARYTPVDGPPLITVTRDVETEVEAWRERRLARRREAAAARAASPTPPSTQDARSATRLVPPPRALTQATAGFSHTDTCCSLSAVNGARSHPDHRSFKRSPAIRAIRSSSAGQT